jgi:hypothetical protein
MANASRSRRQVSGLGVDVFGDPAFDPSENVKALNEAANQRQDDLRAAHNNLMAAEVRRLDAEAGHLKEIADIRERHAKEIRAAETERLNSIRQVDVTAVRTEADRALAAIQTLAATTATNAENLRNALNATAATIAKSTSDTVQQITERIAALEKSSYEGVGKQRLADPQMAELLLKVETMRGTNQGGVDRMTQLLVGAVGLAIAAAMYFK